MADQHWVPAGEQSIPLLAHDNGDGTFSLPVRAGVTRGVNDLTVHLAGAPAIPFLAVNNGDGTFSLSTFGAGSGSAAGADSINVRNYGAIGDGTSHVIGSSDITSHPNWIGTYVSGDEWDYVGIQEAIYACFAVNSTPGSIVWNGHTYRMLNSPLHIPHGQYLLNKTLTAKYLVGALIEGDGRRSTILQKQAAGHLFETNGCGYSQFHGLSFLAGAELGTDSALFSLDWDNTIGPNGAAALQANSFYDCQFDCTLRADYGMSIGWTGYMGSENQFFNCHWNSSLQGGLVCWNYNSLQNQVWGGNFASHRNNAVWCEAGAINVYGVGFQNGTYDVVGGVPVPVQAGYDLYYNNNSSACATISGCRSESLQILSVGAGRQVSLDTMVTRSQANTTWAATTAYNVGDCVGPAGRLYVVTTAGTSDSSQPAFSGLSSYTDGSVVWRFLDFTTVYMNAGSITNSTLPWGKVSVQNAGSIIISNCMFSREDWLTGSPFSSGVGGNGTVLWNNQVQYSGQLTSGIPVPYAMQLNAPSGAKISSTAGLNLGEYPLVFSTGAFGSAYGDVGIGPGDGDTSGGISRRILAVYGALGKVTPIGSNLPGTDTYIYGGLSTGTGTPGKIHLGSASTGSSGAGVNNPTDIAVIDSAGVHAIGYRTNEGSNAKQGVATLIGGTVTVANTSVTSTSRILLTAQSLGTVTTPKALGVTARAAGTSFTITSADATDTSVVAYEIFEVG